MKNTEPILRVNFKKNSRTLKPLGGGLYIRQNTTGTTYYWRITNGHRQQWKALSARTERLARLELGKLRAEHHMAKHGLAPDPLAKNTNPTIANLIEFYIKHNCPTRNETPRTGRQLKEELRRIKDLQPFWHNKLATEITLEDCRDYRDWRLKRIKRPGFSGLRTIDLELCTLSAIFTWALKNPKKTGVTANPIAIGRTRYQKPANIRHCRDYMPATGTEFHALATVLFQDPRSEVLAWQLLFEGLIGQRSHEILRLRTDATNRYEPGYIQNNHLYLYRSATHKGTYPFIQIHDALAECIMAYCNWRAIRGITSPWWFPSPQVKGAPVISSALTRALRRICPALGLPRRTSHGLRAFYVNVLRSKGIPDYEIALRIGQKTGGTLIVNVYGEKLPYTLDWYPEPKQNAEGKLITPEPAWAIWL